MSNLLLADGRIGAQGFKKYVLGAGRFEVFEEFLCGREVNPPLRNELRPSLVTESGIHHIDDLLHGEGFLLRPGRRAEDQARRQQDKSQHRPQSHGNLVWLRG